MPIPKRSLWQFLVQDQRVNYFLKFSEANGSLDASTGRESAQEKNYLFLYWVKADLIPCKHLKEVRKTENLPSVNRRTIHTKFLQKHFRPQKFYELVRITEGLFPT